MSDPFVCLFVLFVCLLVLFVCYFCLSLFFVCLSVINVIHLILFCCISVFIHLIFHLIEGVIAERFNWEYKADKPIPGQQTPLKFNAELLTRSGSRDLEGEGLWRMGIYGSKSPDGSETDRFGYVSQALNPEGASTTLDGGFPMQIRNQEVDFDLGSIGCNGYGYMCAEFSKGDAPNPDYKFEVVRRSDVASNEVLTSCKKQKCSARKIEIVVFLTDLTHFVIPAADNGPYFTTPI